MALPPGLPFRPRLPQVPEQGYAGLPPYARPPIMPGDQMFGQPPGQDPSMPRGPMLGPGQMPMPPGLAGPRLVPQHPQMDPMLAPQFQQRPAFAPQQRPPMLAGALGAGVLQRRLQPQLAGQDPTQGPNPFMRQLLLGKLFAMAPPAPGTFY